MPATGDSGGGAGGAKYFPSLAVDVLKTGNDFTQRQDPVVWPWPETSIASPRHRVHHAASAATRKPIAPPFGLICIKAKSARQR